jgi:hypothetical protein
MVNISGENYMKKETKSTLVVAVVSLAVVTVAFVYLGTRHGHDHSAPSTPAAGAHDHGDGKLHSHDEPAKPTKPAELKTSDVKPYTSTDISKDNSTDAPPAPESTHDHGDGVPHKH